MLRLKYQIQGKIGSIPVYLRISNGKKYDFRIKTQFFIDYNDWDSKNDFPRPKKCSRIKTLSIQLSELKERIFSSYQRDITTKEINSDWFNEIIFPKVISPKITQESDRFICQIENYIHHISHRVEKTTTDKYTRLINLFQKLESHHKRKFNLMDLNSNFGALLDEYCKKVKYSKNYTAKIFDFIKTVWIYSRDCGFLVSNDFNKVKFSEEPTDSIYLNTDELRLIQNCDLLHSNLDDVRDWLMIGCYTGARVSDLLNLTMQDITEQYDRDSNRHIRVLSFIQKKTKNRIWVPIRQDGMVEQILAKRNGNFPRKISAQKFNDYIKEVGKIAGITNIISGSKIDPLTKRKVKGKYHKYELITSHICRRSFATNYYGKISTPLLMTITGHKKEADFFKYIRKSPNEQIGMIADLFD